MTEETPQLAPFLEALKVGSPLSHAGLTLFALSGNDESPLDYVLGAEAIEAGTLTVTEVDESGSVPELWVESTADTMVLLIDGEELVGAKQNRILNTSVLLPPRAEAKIPVSCVEEGRWRHMSPAFRSGSYSPSRLRARKSRDVGRNLRERGEARSDQGAVWEEVAASMAESGAHSETMAMHDAVEQRRESLGSYLDALPYPEDARGVIAAIGGKLAAADCFDKAETLRDVWPRLVAGYALDAIATREKSRSGLSEKAVRRVTEHLGGLDCQPCPTVGVGQDWRFESESLVGQALVAEGACVHWSAFPNDQERGGRAKGPRIVPPSRRRN